MNFQIGKMITNKIELYFKIIPQKYRFIKFWNQININIFIDIAFLFSSNFILFWNLEFKRMLLFSFESSTTNYMVISVVPHKAAAESYSEIYKRRNWLLRITGNRDNSLMDWKVVGYFFWMIVMIALVFSFIIIGCSVV